MPEEFNEVEPQSEPLVEQTEEAVAAEPTPPQEDNRIPYDRFREVNEAKNRAEQELHQMRLFMLQQQQAQLAQAQQQKDPIVDPDVEALVAPVLKKHLTPYQQEIQRLQRMNIELAAKAEAENAWEYVKHNVPDIEELREDILSWVNSQSPTIQKKVTSDPDQVIIVANMIRASKQAGNRATGSAAQQQQRSRAKTATGAPSANPTSSENVDWAAMDSKTFNETLKKMGIRL